MIWCHCKNLIKYIHECDTTNIVNFFSDKQYHYLKDFNCLLPDTKGTEDNKQS